ncbi:MAG: iron-containing alcohol dehydrogenase [Promethearchaeota archaeon]
MWFYYSPTVIFGEDSLDHFDKIAERLKEKENRAFIVTDRGIVKAGLTGILTDKLDECEIKWKIFDEVEPDPHEDTIIKATEICKTYEPNLIIGLGGGSSMDAAKGVWVLYERPDLTIDDIQPFETLNLGKKAKMIAIPTTTGTGSETTWAIIVTRTEGGITRKLEQGNKEAVPDIAILDPRFCKTLPPNLTAATGFDAVGHAIEGYISSWKNDYSDALSVGAYDIIREFLPKAYKDGNDMEAREKMQNAACMAGLSFGNSQVILNHSLAHTFGSQLHVPHGLGVGVFLTYVLQYSMNDPETGKKTKEMLGKFAKMVGIAEWSDSDEIASQKLIDDIKKLQEKVDFPKTLKKLLDDLGISKEKLDEKMDLITRQIYESSSAVMSPRCGDLAEFKRIISYAYEGKDIDF